MMAESGIYTSASRYTTLTLTCKAMNYQNRSPGDAKIGRPQLKYILVVDDLRSVPVQPCKQMKLCSNGGGTLRQSHKQSSCGG